MFLKISKVFYLLLLLYVDMYIYLFTEINNMPLLLASGMLITFLFHFIFNRKAIEITIPTPLWCLLIFATSSFFIGYIIVVDKSHFISSMSVYFLYLGMVLYIINISVIEKTNIFFVKSFFIYSIMYLFIMHIFGVEWAGRLSLSLDSNSNNDANTLLYGLFCLFLFSNNKKLSHMLTKMAITFFYVYTIFLTGSRKALVAALFMWGVWVIFVYGGYFRKYSPLKKILSVLVTIGMIAFAMFKVVPVLMSSRIYERLLGGGTAVESNQIREGMYEEAYNFFIDNPLTGLGYNQFRLNSVYETYSHSTYAELIANTGIIGTILYLLAYLIIFFNLFNLLIKNKGKIDRLRIVDYIIIMITFVALGFGTIHFYGIIDNFLIAIVISYYFLEKKNLDKNSLRFQGT